MSVPDKGSIGSIQLHLMSKLSHSMASSNLACLWELVARSNLPQPLLIIYPHFFIKPSNTPHELVYLGLP